MYYTKFSMYVNVDQCKPNEEWLLNFQPTAIQLARYLICHLPNCQLQTCLFIPWFPTFLPFVFRILINSWNCIWVVQPWTYLFVHWFPIFLPYISRNLINSWNHIWTTFVIWWPTMAKLVNWIERFLQHIVMRGGGQIRLGSMIRIKALGSLLLLCVAQTSLFNWLAWDIYAIKFLD